MIDFLTDTENFWVVVDGSVYAGSGRLSCVEISRSSGMADLGFVDGSRRGTARPVAPSIVADAETMERANVIEMDGYRVSGAYAVPLRTTA